jgi:nicotinamidase-related amidase
LSPSQKRAALSPLPIVHSTVNVKTGLNKPPIAHLRKVLGDLPTFDRTSINAWEDVEFAEVTATGRRKLIMTALWTEACLTFPALDALQAGYEVYVVADAVGGLANPTTPLTENCSWCRSVYRTST